MCCGRLDLLRMVSTHSSSSQCCQAGTGAIMHTPNDSKSSRLEVLYCCVTWFYPFFNEHKGGSSKRSQATKDIAGRKQSWRGKRPEQDESSAICHPYWRYRRYGQGNSPMQSLQLSTACPPPSRWRVLAKTTVPPEVPHTIVFRRCTPSMANRCCLGCIEFPTYTRVWPHCVRSKRKRVGLRGKTSRSWRKLWGKGIKVQ